MPDSIPEEVKRLVAEHITSVEQLEILLLLRDRPEENWTVKSVADEMRTSERSAAARLEDLAARGFLSRRADRSAPRYRFEPTTALRRSVALLDEAYRERRFTVIDMIFSKPIENLRLYAEAFRIRKDESDG